MRTMWKKKRSTKAKAKYIDAIIAADEDARVVRCVKARRIEESEDELFVGDETGRATGARWPSILLITKDPADSLQHIKFKCAEDELHDSAFSLSAGSLVKGSPSLGVGSSSAMSKHPLVPTSSSGSPSFEPETVKLKIQKSDSIDSGHSGDSGLQSDQSEASSEPEQPEPSTPLATTSTSVAAAVAVESKSHQPHETAKMSHSKTVKFQGMKTVQHLIRSSFALAFAAAYRREETTKLSPMECAYGNTQILTLEPYFITTERINQRHYEATFGFKIPPACLNLNVIKQAGFKFILGAEANYKFQTAYFLTTRYQLVYAGTKESASTQCMEMEDESEFLHATCFSHNCRPDSPTSLFFALTQPLVGIVAKLLDRHGQANNKKEKKQNAKPKNPKQKKAAVDFLRLDLTLRRRCNLSPSTVVEKCDVGHLFQPALLFIEWEHLYGRGRAII